MKKRLLGGIIASVMAVSGFSGLVYADENKPTGIAVSVESETLGNIFFDKAPVDFDIAFENNDPQTVKIDADYKVTDIDGRTVLEGEFEAFDLKAGEKKAVEFAPGVMEYGPYVLQVSYNDKVEKINFSSAVKSESEVTNGTIGIPFDSLTGPVEEQRNLIELMLNAGIKWARGECYWDNVERERGVFDFEKWDSYVNETHAAGINLLMILNYGNGLYGGNPHDEEGYEAFATYCRKLAERYKGKIEAYEVWNEYNGAWSGGYGPETYAEMLKYAYKAIKEVDPDVPVVACATADCDIGWIRGVLNAGGIDYMDAISIHPYTYPVSPEGGGLLQNIRKVHALAKEYGKEVDVWCTEFGYPSVPAIMDEVTAGIYNARTYLYSKIIGNDKMFIFNMRNASPDTNNSEHNFGIIRALSGEMVNYAAKPGYLMLANATNLLNDATLKGTTPENDNIQIHSYDKDGEGILAYWAVIEDANISLNVGCEEVTLVDWMGNEKTVKTTNGIVTVSVSERPAYMKGSFSDYTIVESDFKLEETNVSIANGADVNLVLNRGDVIPGAGSIEADLPVGFTMASDTEFEAGSDDIKIVLKVDTSVEKGRHRCIFDIKSGDTIVGELSAVVNTVNETDITITPVLYDRYSWKTQIDIVNNSSTKKLSGKITVTEPAEYADVVIEVPDLKTGEKFTGYIDMLTYPAEPKWTELKVKFESNNGDVKEILRPISCLAAVKANGEIVIDGVESEGEWDNSMLFHLGDLSKLHGFRGADGYEEYYGEHDISATGYLKWDDENFYMLIKVRDDIHDMDSEGSGIWQADGLQYCIDASRSWNGISNLEWHEIGIGVDESGKKQEWKWRTVSGISGGEVSYDSIAVRDEELGEDTYEVKIPWSKLLQRGSTIGEGNLLAFTVIANESDGKGRDGWIRYMQGASGPKATDRMGDVILMDKLPEAELSDENYAWADDYANRLYKKGVISADYNAGAEITKGEFIAMVVKAMGKENEEFDKSTVNVSEDYEYYKEIGIAKKLGIAFGDGEEFDTEEKLSRQDMMTILERTMDIEADAEVALLEHFKDYDNISDYALQSIANLVCANIIVGDGQFLNPLNNTTMAEAVTAVCKFVK